MFKHCKISILVLSIQSSKSTCQVAERGEEVVLADLEHLPELLEGEGGEGAEAELGVVVRRRLVEAAAVLREGHRLDRHEVLHQQVPVNCQK